MALRREYMFNPQIFIHRSSTRSKIHKDPKASWAILLLVLPSSPCLARMYTWNAPSIFVYPENGGRKAPFQPPLAIGQLPSVAQLLPS